MHSEDALYRVLRLKKGDTSPRAARSVKTSGKLLKNEVDRNSRRVVENKLEKIVYLYSRMHRPALVVRKAMHSGEMQSTSVRATERGGHRKYSPRLFREFSYGKFISPPGECGFASVPISYDYHMFVTAYHRLADMLFFPL